MASRVSASRLQLGVLVIASSLLALALLLVLGTRASSAGGGAGEDAAARLIRQAEQAEQEARLDVALELYARILEQAPQSRLARRARLRREWLEARGGASAELTELVKMQRLAPGALTQDLLLGFEQRVDAFPPGPVRSAARGFIAEAWYHRLGLPARAVPAFERWLEEPELSEADWALATTELALARADLGDLRGSIHNLRGAGLGRRAETSHLELTALRRWAQPLAWALIGAFSVSALVLGRRGFTRAGLAAALAPGRLALGAWLLGAPLLIAYLHRPATWEAMVLLAPGAAVLVLVASIAGTALGGSAALRRALMALGVAAQVGLAYLAVDRSLVLLATLVNYKLK